MSLSTRSQRWSVAIGISLALVSAGLWVKRPSLVIAAMVPIAFIAYSSLMSAPTVEADCVCRRTITPTRTYAGETVAVELTIENQSKQFLADLRVVDGVPDELAVVRGSPRRGLTLREGETATIEYTLRARYGTFEFDPVTAKTYSLSADHTYTTDLTVTGDNQLNAMFDPESYPLARQTVPIVGSIEADRGDEGLEFHSIRPYQPEDPASRINWRQYARDRVLSTINYRPQEGTEVLVIVDARPSAGTASSETAPTGTELCVSLGRDLVESLLTDRNRVGALTLGVDPTETAATVAGPTDSGAMRQLPWVPPANTPQIRLQIEQLLDAAAATVRPSADHNPGESEFDTEPIEIIQQLTQRTQVILITPLCDSYPVELVEQLTATGHAVTVYSPRTTTRQTTSGQLVATQRRLRVRKLRERGITVIDWLPEEPLAVAFDRGTINTNGELVS